MATQKHENPDNEKRRVMKRPKVERAVTNAMCCQRLARAFEEVLVTSKNETFRSECFEMLGVGNSVEAGEKILELATAATAQGHARTKKEDDKSKK
jgi:hypothetical protein